MFLKKISIVLVIIPIVFGGVYFSSLENLQEKTDERAVDDSVKIKEAFENRRSNLQVRAIGKVTSVLADDNKGSKHQRFILKLSTGQTVLIAHNIDLAPRIETIKIGDDVEFFGEYEWNEKGGVIHWTHRDPKEIHLHGWLKHNNKIYW